MEEGRMLIRLREEERGMAMVVALMVSFVVMLLSVFVVQLSLHNSAQSAYDRERVTSITAAEAGIDQMWASLQSTNPASLPCASPATGTVSSGPGTGSYSVSAVYYDSSGATMSCPLSSTATPAAAELTSTGTTVGQATRKMQSYATLTPIRTGLNAAIISNSGTSFANSFTLNGNGSDNADIYVDTGDLDVSNLPAIHGNVYVPTGAYSQTNNSVVYGNVWANGSITINNPATITGNGTSSTSSITKTGGNGGTINGNATAGTTINASVTVGGTKSPNSPQGAPPSMPIPPACWSTSGSCTGQSSAWTTSPNNYTVHTDTDCTAARTYLETGTLTGDIVERITSVCNLNIANNDSINFTGNLAIFTDGSITMNQQNNWNGSAGKNLYLIVNYRSGLTCGTYPGSYDITTSNNSNFNNVQVAFYTPCTISIANQNAFSGQILGNSVQITNNATINFKPTLIPGTGTITGFTQSIVYLREAA
jgi:Tfp pilus assembly protein PilX